MASSDRIFLLLTTSEEVQIITSSQKDILQQLQDLVGSYIETSPHARVFGITSRPSQKGYKWVIVVNKEGMVNGSAYNPFPVDDLFGDIVIGQLSGKGDIVGFPKDDLKLLPERITKHIKE